LKEKQFEFETKKNDFFQQTVTGSPSSKATTKRREFQSEQQKGENEKASTMVKIDIISHTNTIIFSILTHRSW
jgi:ABC-type bacteriocin/lantibiotic exporter with double-glycine peptidase domain